MVRALHGRGAVLLTSLFVMSSLALGCGKSGSSSGQPPGAGGGPPEEPGSTGDAGTVTGPPLVPSAPLTVDEFLEAADEISRRVAAVGASAGSASREEVASRLLEGLAGTPRMADAGIGPDGSVWARLVDGTPFVVALDRDFPASPAPLRAPAALPALQTGLIFTAPSGGPFALPRSEKAWLAQTDNLAPIAQREITAMLAKQHYTATTDGSVRAFREDVKDIGVLWLSTHGLQYPDPSGRYRYVITTAEEVKGACALSAAECAKNHADIAAKRAGVGTLLDGRQFIAINSDWVLAYWKLADKALVFLDACSSGRGSDPANREFTAALKGPVSPARPAGTEITLLGWSGLVEKNFAEEAAMWFFSRVLGSDAYLPPSPPQRPFSAVEVWASMQKQPRGTGNRATDPSNPGTVLMLSQFGAEASILVPSIRNMAVDEAKRELHLFGQFGDVAGDVTVSGITAAPMSWNQTEVVVLIPDVGADSMGDTIAKARNQSSNAAPLTSWVGTSRLRHTFSGTYGAPGPWYELDCSKVHFRADIHPWRFEPDGNAVAGTTFFGDVYDSRILIGNLTRDSECSGQADAFGDKTDGTTTLRYGYTMPKRALPWADQEATPPDNWFFGFGHIDPVARQLVLGTSSLADAANDQWFQRIAPPPVGDVFTVSIPFSSAAANDVLIKRPPHPLDAQFGVTKHTDSFAVPFGPWVDQGLVEVELTAEPTTLPDGNTPG